MQSRTASDFVSEARKFHHEADNSLNKESKIRSLVAASKSYGRAAQLTTNTELKHSVAFLANWCAQQALICKGVGNATAAASISRHDDADFSISSNRLLSHAHLMNQKRMEHVTILCVFRL
jgi:hypothetical protein